MIAVDLQPYSIVEDEGFIQYSKHLEPRYKLPSRRLLAERVILDMYMKVKETVQKSVNSATKISFTTDTWTESTTTKAFIGVSAHWIDSEWQRKFAVLNCEEFSGKHTGDMIAVKFERVLAEWNVPKESCVVVLRDNAANMVKAFDRADIPSIGCALHTFQLAIHDCIFDQRVVSDALAVCRRLVGHFKHSSLASQRLADIQRELQSEVLRPVQDVATRWNSTYYMIERLLKIKRSVSVLCSETDGMQDKTLTPNMWSIIENVKHMLEPLEKLTGELSAYEASLSAVIPAVLGLKLTLEADHRDSGVKTMKAGLIAAITERFEHLLANEVATCATALDPRFKLAFLITDAVRDTVRSKVLNSAIALTRHATQSQSGRSVDDAAGTTASEQPSSSSLTSVPSTSTADSATGGEGDIWAALYRMSEGGMTPIVDDSSTVAVTTEVSTYFSEPLIPFKEDPLVWWKGNQYRYPFLAQLARVYLSPPPSSVQSERIFSTAGQVYDDRRSRLLPDNAEKLVFLKFNLPLINFKY